MNDTQKDILTTVPVDYQDRVKSEAHIRWALSGGAYSSYLSQVAREVNKALDAGREPSFPSTKWNDDMIERRKKERGF